MCPSILISMLINEVVSWSSHAVAKSHKLEKNMKEMIMPGNYNIVFMAQRNNTRCTKHIYCE